MVSLKQTILEVDGISLEFMHGKLKYNVIDDISFDVKEYEFLSIVGPSGCGKSSLIRIIAGLLSPTKGRVRFYGKEVIKPEQGMSLVFQNFALLPWLTALENVELALASSGMSSGEIHDKSMKVLEKVNLSGFEATYPSELSGGMKQRVGMARALVSSPKLLLMDEPFSSLDDLTASQLRAEVVSILKNTKTSVKSVIMISHNVDEVAHMSDKIIVMSKPPSKIVDKISIEMKYPRSKGNKTIEGIINRIYSDLY